MIHAPISFHQEGNNMYRTFKLSLIAFAAFATAPISAATSPATAPAALPPKTQAQPAKAVQPQVPPNEAIVIMIRSALLAVSQANMTNNYTVLNALGSPAFRVSNTPQRLSQAFEQFRTNQIDIAPVVYVMPQLTYAPIVDKGKLRVVGLFPTQPMQVNYNLSYEVVGDKWMLSDIAVNLERRVASR
jgi:hypothetical protein